MFFNKSFFIKVFTKKLKEKVLTEDQIKNFEKEVQKLTDENISKIEKALTEKEKEIIQI